MDWIKFPEYKTVPSQVIKSSHKTFFTIAALIQAQKHWATDKETPKELIIWANRSHRSIMSCHAAWFFTCTVWFRQAGLSRTIVSISHSPPLNGHCFMVKAEPEPPSLRLCGSAVAKQQQWKGHETEQRHPRHNDLGARNRRTPIIDFSLIQHLCAPPWVVLLFF